MTCAHVIEDPTNHNPIAQSHLESDRYILLNHDDEDNFHYHIGSFKKGTDLTIQLDYDLAIVDLPESFYKAADGTVLRSEGDYIRISSSTARIGTPVGVLGYPLAVLAFEARDVMKPKVADVILRADSGIVNAKYVTEPQRLFYDYTMAFNPGNSGGPVFDMRSGRAIAVVKGFRTVDIATREVQLPAAMQTDQYRLPTYISTTSASYSTGIGLASIRQVLDERGVDFG